jgi:hypothetical protein
LQTVAIGSSTCSLFRRFSQQDSLRSWLVYLVPTALARASHTPPRRYSTTGSSFSPLRPSARSAAFGPSSHNMAARCNVIRFSRLALLQNPSESPANSQVCTLLPERPLQAGARSLQLRSFLQRSCKGSQAVFNENISHLWVDSCAKCRENSEANHDKPCKTASTGAFKVRKQVKSREGSNQGEVYLSSA